MSAAKTQMNALNDEGMIAEDTMVDLLENKIVVIVPSDSDLEITEFADIVKADTIALGDPASVPCWPVCPGSFDKSRGLGRRLPPEASWGTNVTEVLNWVAEGSADCRDCIRHGRGCESRGYGCGG